MEVEIYEMQTPVGFMQMAIKDGIVLWFQKIHSATNRVLSLSEAIAHHCDAVRFIGAYFQGENMDFQGELQYKGSIFQQRVWEALRQIPYGDTCSYQEIARRIRKPNAVRAVANAIGANPVWIIIPCHRVIRSDGGIGGYAGGIEMKRYLLELESKGRR